MMRCWRPEWKALLGTERDSTLGARLGIKPRTICKWRLSAGIPRYVSPALPHGILPDRFLDKVSPEPMSGCWLWTASVGQHGYGWFSIRHATVVLAHRFAYEAVVGPIPAGLFIDHLCRVRTCVNPRHLEPVTNRENCLRGISPAAVNAGKTHCKRGHPLSGETLWTRPNGQRICRICKRSYEAARRLRVRGAA